MLLKEWWFAVIQPVVRQVLWGAAKLAFLQQEFLWVLSSAICQEAPHFNPPLDPMLLAVFS